MTNRSKFRVGNTAKFRVGNTGHGRYLIVGAGLSNFCQSFGKPWGTFSSKMESLQKGKRFWESGKKVRKILKIKFIKRRACYFAIAAWS